MQQLILGTGTAIWWLTEPHWVSMKLTHLSPVQYWFIKSCSKVFIRKMMAWCQDN